jgi:predicted  nucleic acid-binding Zn-ribbon protein
MCGGKAQAPQIIYQGPSQEEIDANNAQLETYRQQVTDQQSAFKAQLQAQIDEANRKTADLQYKTASDSAAAAAAAAAQQLGAYAVNATQTEAASGAATTTAASMKKEKPNNLRITPAAAPAAAGAGLNIGV